MRKPFYSIVTNKATKTADIMLYGIIGQDMWGQGITAKAFVNDFKALDQTGRINVHINGPGGSVWDGLPIFNVINNSPADTHTYNDGIAFSMSGVILLAGKTVHVCKGSMAMLHNVGGGVGGNAQDMRKAADILDKHDKVLIGLIADKTGKTEDEVKALWMNYEDNFLTGQEMIDCGMADVMEDTQAKDCPTDPQNMTLDQIAAFYNERAEEPSPTLIEKVTNELSKIFPIKNKPNMKFPAIFALVGVPVPTAAQISAVKAELAAAGIIGYGIFPEADITNAATLGAENTRLTGELATAVEANTVAVAATATANTTATAANAELVTANATIVANASKITALEAQVTAFGKNSGAKHIDPKGADTVTGEEDDFATAMAKLPHNQNADKVIGVKPAAATV